MDMPRLSLCIPTYNRVKYLRELLPPLLAEVEMANGDVLRIEVVVSNNDSADETDGYVSSLSSPALVYQRNPSNIGAICNFHACIDRARGDYIWLFGDDELFEPGGITRLLDCLDHDQPALVVLRDASRPDAGKGLMVYSGYRECLLQEMQANAAFALSHTLITANVFRKDVFDQPTVKAKQTSAYGQMYALAAGLQRGGKVAVLDGVMRVPDDVVKAIEDKGIKVIVKRTGDACDEYNQLSQIKNVIAALHLTC